MRPDGCRSCGRPFVAGQRNVASALAGALALWSFGMLKEHRGRTMPGMLRATLVGLLLGVSFAADGVCVADATTGAVLYRKYCASCHGTAGRGDGPVSPVLRTPPTDLTTVRSNVRQLMRQIDGRSAIRAHGTSQMPVWGEVFEESLIAEPYPRRTTLQKLQMLAEYVRSLQKE